jgi:predicted nucleotidyltransferase
MNIIPLDSGPGRSLSVGIAGIPDDAAQRLLQLLCAQPRLAALWLFGSRAMGRYRPGSDIDLCLDGAELTHQDRVDLMVAIDDLLLPWSVDLVLRHEMPSDLEAHLQRVGICLWRRLSPELGHG